MKKLSTALALILCLVLCLFAFASCSKKGKTDDTTKVPETTAGKTECAHVWGEYTVDTEATCTKEGSESIYCTICEAKKPGSTRPIAKKPHTPSEDYKTVTPATCTTDGLEAKYCTVCQTVLEGEGMTRPIVAAGTDHVVTAWDDEVEATLRSAGRGVFRIQAGRLPDELESGRARGQSVHACEPGLQDRRHEDDLRREEQRHVSPRDERSLLSR